MHRVSTSLSHFILLSAIISLCCADDLQKLDPNYDKPKPASASKKPSCAEGSVVAPARGRTWWCLHQGKSYTLYMTLLQCCC